MTDVPASELAAAVASREVDVLVVPEVGPAVGVNRMGDVGMQLQPGPAVAGLVLQVPLFVQVITAVIAVTGPEVIFVTAARAVIAELARGHGDEQSVIALDQLQKRRRESV